MCTSLLTSLFRSDAVVPDNLVVATPALRKKCSKIRGTAGPRRARLIREIAKQKKTLTSKIGFVNDPVPAVPDPVRPTPDPVPPVRDATPPPTARADNLIVPPPEVPSTSED